MATTRRPRKDVAVIINQDKQRAYGELKLTYTLYERRLTDAQVLMFRRDLQDYTRCIGSARNRIQGANNSSTLNVAHNGQ